MSELNQFETILNTPSLQDLVLSETKGVFADFGEGLQKLPFKDLSWAKPWLLDTLSKAGCSWDARYPFINVRLLGGERLHASMPPISQQGLLISIRKPCPQTSDDHWEKEPFDLLRNWACNGKNIVIAGSTGSGKTTLAKDLIATLKHEERILILEDTHEISIDHPHTLNLSARLPNADGKGEVTLRNILKEALRMRPDRLILGECRGKEVLDLLLALNTGHTGLITTLHANSSRDALRRIEILSLLSAPEAMNSKALKELLAATINGVVFLKKVQGQRKIVQIDQIAGLEGDTILLRQMLHCTHEHT